MQENSLGHVIQGASLSQGDPANPNHTAVGSRLGLLHTCWLSRTWASTNHQQQRSHGEHTMKKTSLISALLFVLLLSGCATTKDGATWKCTANGLVDSMYSGGDYAYIHLQGFSKGGDYKVQLNNQKTVATGTTANGTPFTCTRVK